MKIELEYPYTTKYKAGYTVTNGENRKHVCLIGHDGSRTTTAYARYLMSVANGRFLSELEEVDHIDHDKTNDALENLQILSSSENREKARRFKGRKVTEIECPECHMVFIRRSGNTQAVECNRGRVTLCSKKCSNVFRKRNYSAQQRQKISEDTLLRVFSLTE